MSRSGLFKVVATILLLILTGLGLAACKRSAGQTNGAAGAAHAEYGQINFLRGGRAATPAIL